MSEVPDKPPVPVAGGSARRLPVWLKAGIGIIILVLLIVAVLSLLPVPLEGNISTDIRNEQVYAALAANNITDAAVDTRADRVLVSAVVTDNAIVTKVKYIVAGAVSQTRDPPPLIVVEVFDRDNRLAETSRIETAAVNKYLAGDMTMVELEKSIRIP